MPAAERREQIVGVATAVFAERGYDGHAAIHAQGRAALGSILGGERGAANITGSGDPESLEMAAEVMRAGLAGLALWWSEHPHVPRERIVTTAVNVLWVGFATVSSRPAPPASP